MAPSVHHRQFTVAEYHRLAEAGVLTEDDHTELLDGELYVMSPMRSRHAGAVDELVRLLARRVEDRFLVRCQTPVRLGERDEPEPDLSIARWREDKYSRSIPTPGDLVLVIEVADTTYDYDFATKRPRYAQAGVPVLWIVDLERRRIEVHEAPQHGVYTRSSLVLPGSSVTVPGSAASIAVDEVCVG